MEIEERYRPMVMKMESRGFKTHKVHKSMGPAVLLFQKNVPGTYINVDLFDLHEVPNVKNQLRLEVSVQFDLGPMTMNVMLFSFDNFFMFLDMVEEFVVCLHNFSEMFWTGKYTKSETKYE